jgi:acetyl esterase/lipase
MKGKTSLLLFFTIMLSSAVSLNARQEGTPVPYRAIEDLVYGHKDGLALTLDVLTPEQNPKNIGLLLISSGSWKSRKPDVSEEETRRRQTEHWIQGLLRGGYTLFIVRHGSAPRYFVPEMTPDIRRAIRYVRLHAKEYGVNPDFLGITSGSSGGHLSLMAANSADDGKPGDKDPVERVSSRIQAVVAWFPPTDLINWGGENGYKSIGLIRPTFFQDVFGKITNLEEQLKSISPIYQVTPDDPPLLLIHGDADKTVPLQQSQVLKEKYEGTGIPVKLIVHPGGGHSYWPGILDQYPDVWAWFDKYLKAGSR